MARPKTKEELIQLSNTNFEKLWELIDSMSVEALNTDFDFSDEPNKKEAHWGRDKNLRDIFIHLYEWHQLLLNWIKSNKSGENIPFLPEGYTWKTYGEMNIEFWKKHQNTELESSETMLKKSHLEVLDLINKFSNEELFTKKYFAWTGTTSLGSYCVSAMSSHYDWAIKKLKAHIKKLKTKLSTNLCYNN